MRHHLRVQAEYCRDEGLRASWDEYGYPFHKQGDGPLHKGQDAGAYNQNQDRLTVEFVRRWYDCGVSVPEQRPAMSIQEAREIVFPMRRLMDVVRELSPGGCG
ncbi:MAG: hypothetical protein ACLUVG_16500 [Phocaeicola vulgatus]